MSDAGRHDFLKALLHLGLFVQPFPLSLLSRDCFNNVSCVGFKKSLFSSKFLRYFSKHWSGCSFVTVAHNISIILNLVWR